MIIPHYYEGPAHTVCGYHAESCLLHSGIAAQRCLGRSPRDLGPLPAFERQLEVSVLRQHLWLAGCFLRGRL